MAIPLVARDIMARVAPWIRYFSELCEVQQQVQRERRALNNLDDAQLRDIGVSRAAATEEAGRSFHDIPASRRPAHPDDRCFYNATTHRCVMQPRG